MPYSCESPLLAAVSTIGLSAAVACTVCFGETDGGGVQGLLAAAGLLAGLVYGVLAVFGLVMWRARRRAVRSGGLPSERSRADSSPSIDGPAEAGEA